MLIAAALSFEGFGANLSVIHEAAARMRPHAGEVKASARLRELMVGSGLWEPARRATSRTRSRSGACRRPRARSTTRSRSPAATMEIELNSAGDNPLVVVEEDAIVSVGNFDVAALAMAFDCVRLGFAHAAQVSNERVQKLLWDHFSGLPTGLTASDGPTGGLRPLGRAVRGARRGDALRSPTPSRSTTADRWPRASRTTRRWRRSPSRRRRTSSA